MGHGAWGMGHGAEKHLRRKAWGIGNG